MEYSKSALMLGR